MPVISVLMSVYNGEKFLAESVRSILGQTFKDFEFIILDDGSTDSTMPILDELAKSDLRVKIIKNEKNLGLTLSLNKGLNCCIGKYIARQDVDDVSSLWRLEKQLAYMEANPEVILSGSCGSYIDENSKKVCEKKLPLSYLEIKRKLMFNNQFIHSSLMIRRDVLQKEGGYNKEFGRAQDYELILRLASKYPVANLGENLVSRRLSTISLSWQSKKQEWDAIRARWWGMTKYGYSILQGMLNIILRLNWFLIPQKIKFIRYFFI